MKSVLLFLYLASILFSVITAIVYRQAIRGRQLLIMLPYLGLVFIQELGIYLYLLSHPSASTAVVYNIHKPISVLAFFWIYYNLSFMKPLRKVIMLFTVAYFCITLIAYAFWESFFATSSYLALARGFVITFYGILFLFRFFNFDNLAEEKFWRPLLWVTIGIVIYYPVISISVNFQKYLSGATLYGFKPYQAIPQVMSIFMYSCFSYAFYLCRKKS